MGSFRCCQSFFIACCLYFCYSLLKNRRKKNKVVNCRERGTSCHKRLNWARLARQVSQPTACLPSMTSFVASHRRLESHLVPLCCTAGFLLASQDLETSILLLTSQVFLCLVSSCLTSSFSGLRLTALFYGSLSFSINTEFLSCAANDTLVCNFFASYCSL